MGEYVVIDVDTKHYFVDSDSLVALERQKEISRQNLLFCNSWKFKFQPQ